MKIIMIRHKFKNLEKSTFLAKFGLPYFRKSPFDRDITIIIMGMSISGVGEAKI